MANLLDREDLDLFLHGVVHTKRTAHGLHLVRFTARQLDAYAEREGWEIRARCMAGTAIGLRTDSATLRLQAAALARARAHLEVDVEVDGMVVGGHRTEEAGDCIHTPLLDLSGEARRMREIRIWMPHTMELALQALELDDDARIEPLPRQDRRLLTLGDSITQGMAAIAPWSTYPVQLARLLDMELLNQGVGGHVFAAQTLDEGLPYAPDLITIAYGTNDWSSGLSSSELQANARQYLERLRAIWSDAQIVLMTPVWRKIGEERRASGNLREASQAIADAAEGIADVRVFDGYTLVPNQPWYLPDGTHPNEAGFMHYALSIWRNL